MQIRATTEEMLKRIQEGWDKLQNYLASLSYEQATEVTDDGGWTIKDHCMHLAVWEDGVDALLKKESRIARMGISEELWNAGDNDAINDAIFQTHKNKSLIEVRNAFFSIHERLLETISKLSDDDLNLPYKDYEAGSDNEEPVWPSIVGNTFGHYQDHTPWMQAIAEKIPTETRATTEGMLKRIHEGWDKLQAYLATLSDEQLTQPSDAAGWTAKDHLIHLAVWEDGIDALLNHESRNGRMGISDETWEKADHDEVNAIIQKQHKDKPLDEIRKIAADVHQRLITTISKLSDEELNLPYKHYAPEADREEPVFGWIGGNTFGHYEEHTPWIKAIVEKA